MESSPVPVLMKQKPMQSHFRRHLTSYLFLLPSFLFIVAFLYYPIGSALFYGLTDWNLASWKFIGFDNYVHLLQDPTILMSLRNQGILTLTDVLKVVVFPLLAAELIYLLKGTKLKYVFRTSFILPMLVPGIVIYLLWSSIYDPTYGLLNEFLKIIGLGKSTHAWTGDSKTALFAVIFMGFPFVSGLPFLLFYASIGNFNSEIIEAARIDGAKGMNLFRRIHIPLLFPTFKVVIILTIIGSLQDVVKLVVLTKGGGPGIATMIPAMSMYLSAFSASRYGYASAIGTCLFLIIVGLSVVNLRFFKTDY
jgi:raffinose/stachyose/melibiose transport system permease protein